MKINRFVLILFYLIPFAQTTAQLSNLFVTIMDETGQETPVRIRLTHSNGKAAPLPEEAISVMYGQNDAAQGYGYQPDSSAYIEGHFKVGLEPGEYHLSISKGIEYLKQNHKILIESDKDISLTYKLQRWINMPARNWYSADDHIHIRRSPRDNPYILKWIAAEDVHVGVLLQMGDFWTPYYFVQYGWGKDGVYSLDNRLLTSGQEDPRTHEIGHTIAVAADELVRFSEEYYQYDHVFDRVHELNGLTGYAHQGMSFNGYRGMTMDVLQKKVDFLELLQFCVEGGPLLTNHYYFFLDMGFKLTATAGSDFPWCGADKGTWDSQIGNVRFYTYINDTLSFETWKENFKAGHTFVTSGPMIDFRINGKFPGETLRVTKGEEVLITAHAYGHPEQIPLSDLEIIGHSEIIDYVSAKNPNQSTRKLSINKKFKVEEGIWIAAKCQAGPSQIAHTTPVYIIVDESGFHNPKTVRQNLDTCEEYLEEIEAEMKKAPQDKRNNIWRFRDQLSERIINTQEIIDKMKKKL